MTKDKHPSAVEKSPRFAQIELLNDKAQTRDLVLRVNGKNLIISESELSKLLQPNLFKSGNKPAAGENTEFLSQYGIKSARDMISFLKSPTGEKTKKLLGDLLVLLVALKDLTVEQVQREQLLRQLFMAQIRLYIIAKKEARAKLNAAYQQQIDKSLAYGAAVAAQQSSTSTSVNPDYYDNVLRDHIRDSYALATHVLENQLHDSLEEAQLLEEEIALHEAEVARIMERYAILDTHLQALDDHADLLETVPSSAGQIEATEASLLIIQEKIRDLSKSIQQHVVNGENSEAEVLLHHLDGLNVRAEGMRTLLSALQQQKTYYDAEGSQTDSFKNAAYIVENQQHLYKDKESGKLYLLNAGQNFEDMTADEKATAQDNFEQSKPELAVVKHKINQYRTSELGLFAEKKQSLINRSENLQKEILDLTNQFNQAKAAEAGALALILEPKTDLSKVPTPKPTMKSSLSPVKPNFSPTQSYRHILQLMRFNPSQEAINQFKNGLLLANGQPNKAAQNMISNTIRPNERIMGTKMNNLLANLERLGVSANKPGVTSIQSAHPNKPQKENRAGNSPTPFKTTPSPFKN